MRIIYVGCMSGLREKVSADSNEVIIIAEDTLCVGWRSSEILKWVQRLIFVIVSVTNGRTHLINSLFYLFI